MTQEQIIRELIILVTSMVEPERTKFLLDNYEFTVKRKVNAGGGACCY